MKFKLLIIEDDRHFLENMIIKLKAKMKSLNIELDITKAYSLEEVREKIDEFYYIACSIDQSIPSRKRGENVDYGVATSQSLKFGNVLIYPVMFTNYVYDLNFTSILNIGQENYFNKTMPKASATWAEALLKNTQNYIDKDIRKEAKRYLPISLYQKIEKFDSDGNSQSKLEAIISFFEFDLKLIYSSVLATTKIEKKTISTNAKMIQTLKDIYSNLDSYTLSGRQKKEIKKLLSSSLFESLDNLRKMRNDYYQNLEEIDLYNNDIYLDFVNLILHNSYFYTNPLIHIQKKRMRNNILEVSSKMFINIGEEFNFTQKDTSFVDEAGIYQIFKRESTELVSLNHYLERDERETVLTLKVK